MASELLPEVRWDRGEGCSEQSGRCSRSVSEALRPAQSCPGGTGLHFSILFLALPTPWLVGQGLCADLTSPDAEKEHTVEELTARHALPTSFSQTSP